MCTEEFIFAMKRRSLPFSVEAQLNQRVESLFRIRWDSFGLVRDMYIPQVHLRRSS